MTGRQADVMMAAHLASEVVHRMMVPSGDVSGRGTEWVWAWYQMLWLYIHVALSSIVQLALDHVVEDYSRPWLVITGGLVVCFCKLGQIYICDQI